MRAGVKELVGGAGHPGGLAMQFQELSALPQGAVKISSRRQVTEAPVEINRGLCRIPERTSVDACRKFPRSVNLRLPAQSFQDVHRLPHTRERHQKIEIIHGAHAVITIDCESQPCSFEQHTGNPFCGQGLQHCAFAA